MAKSVYMFVLVLLLEVGLGSTQDEAKPTKGVMCEKAAVTNACGMPGVPGSNGMHGIPGVPGPQGAGGAKGGTGQTGHPGAPGVPGVTGLQGMAGLAGDKGDKGEKGEMSGGGSAGSVPQTNWKQCAWKDINDNRDIGKIEACSFNKLQSDTALKVSFQGAMRVMGTGSKCNRWYFKFSGKECTAPMTIEGIVNNSWPSGAGNPNLHHHRSIEGYCENIPAGRVLVEVWVGPCASVASGDAYTGWNSVSRLIMEEVSPRQT